jgi:hypothetical protein
MAEKDQNDSTDRLSVDLNQAIKEAYSQFKSLSPEERERMIGPHVSEELLREFAQGRTDHAAKGNSSRHLSWCKECAFRMLRLEGEHIQRLAAQQDKIVNFAIGGFYKPELARLAAETRRIKHSKDSMAPVQAVLSCRAFQLEVFCEENSVFLAFIIAHPEELESVVCKNVKTDQPIRTHRSETKTGVDYNVGSIVELEGQTIRISFEYEGVNWEKTVNFG